METIIDLRSDTVTSPSRAMLEAMTFAVTGDDVYGEDPTVNSLEEYAAQLTKKEKALFVTSGTQGNLTAILCLISHDVSVLFASANGNIKCSGICLVRKLSLSKPRDNARPARGVDSTSEMSFMTFLLLLMNPRKIIH